MENLGTHTAFVPFHWNTILPNDNWLPVGKNGEIKGFILNCLGLWGIVIADILIHRFWRILLNGLLLWNPYFINLDTMNAKMLKKMKLDADVECTPMTFEWIVVGLMTLLVVLELTGVVDCVRTFQAMVPMLVAIFFVVRNAQVFSSAGGRKHGKSFGCWGMSGAGIDHPVLDFREGVPMQFEMLLQFTTSITNEQR